MVSTIGEYLAQKGGTELLCEIRPNGSRFYELDNALEISHGTLSDRLTQTQDLSLTDLIAISGERGATNKHRLTKQGALLRFRLDQLGVTATYRQYRDARKMFMERKETVTGYAEENPRNFVPHEKEEEEEYIDFETALREAISHGVVMNTSDFPDFETITNPHVFDWPTESTDDED